MYNTPLISVVMASYNHEKFVKEAIDSVLEQSFQDFELIITDDGSDDDTLVKIKEIKNEKIKLYTFEQNQGACAALNNCIINASGKHIAVMNSDDVWLKHKLEIQINYLTSQPNIDAVFSDALFLDEYLQEFSFENNSDFANIFTQENRTSAEWLKKFFFGGNCLCHPSVLIKKNCYDVLGLYDNRFRQLPDFDMWIKFCKKFNLHVLPDKLVKFRILNNNKNTSSITQANSTRGRNELHLIYKSFFDDMLNTTFKEAFAKYFITKNIANEQNYEIEKAFMFLKGLHSIIGIEKLYNLLNNEKYSLLLKQEYKFDDKEFMNITASNNSFDCNTLSGQKLFELLINKINITSKKNILVFLIKKCYQRCLRLLNIQK